MNHIGMFEGIGGFSYAAQQVGWETVAWCEIDPFCQRILKYYFPKAIPHGDVRQTDFKTYNGTVDVFTAGFPCQPYSLAGKRKGTEDDRFYWPETRRAYKEIQPSVIVLENVAGLFTILEPASLSEVERKEIQLFSESEEYQVNDIIERVQRRIIATIIEEIRSDGYILPELEDGTPIILCIPACAINAPHRRDRIWILAYDPTSNRLSRKEQEIENENGKSRPEKIRQLERGLEGLFGYVADTSFQGLQRSEINGIVKKSQQKREQQSARLFSYNWQEFPTVSPICTGDDGLSDRLDGITFPKLRKESIKGGGNAIVPWIAVELFKIIEEIYDL